MDELEDAIWRKSSYSGGPSGNCVEVAFASSGCIVGIRDSKNPQGDALVVTHDQWRAFIDLAVRRQA
jgi:hypothetical protein